MHAYSATLASHAACAKAHSQHARVANQPPHTCSPKTAHSKTARRQFLAEIPGGLGAYSDSAGAAVVRRLIAGAIEKRDGVPCSPDEIYMTVRRGGRASVRQEAAGSWRAV